MSDQIAFTPIPFNPAAPIQSFQNLTNSLDQILESYGAETTGNAATIVGLRAFAEQLKEIINGSCLPQNIKDMANAFIDGHVDSVENELAVPADAVEAVENCEEGTQIAENASEAATEAGEEATAASSPEAAAEEAANESVGGSGSAGGANSAAQAEADAALNTLLGEIGEDKEMKRRCGGGAMNFLIALAEAMGKTQGKFLEMALAEQKKMEGLVGKDGEGDAQAFTTAQSKFSAYMQMFNLYSNQVATGIKTIGEALAAIARKQ